MAKYKYVKIFSLILAILFAANIFNFPLNFCFSGESKSCCCKGQNSDSKNFETEKIKMDCRKCLRKCNDFNIEAKVESFILPDKQNFSFLITDVTFISEQNFSKVISSPDFLIQKFSPDIYIENCNLRI